MPAVASSGATVHVVWVDEKDGSYEVYYKRSSDYGVSWGPNTRLTYNISISQYPSISCNGSTVDVVWHDNGYLVLCAKRSTDNGVTWSPVTRLTGGYNPSVATTANAAHVVWWTARDGNAEIYYKKRLAGGFDGFLTEPSQGRHLFRDPARDVLHMVMKSEQKDSVYYLRSTNSGTSWSSPLLLGYGKYPTVGLAQLPEDVWPPYYAVCVAFRGDNTPGNLKKLRFRWNDNYSDPGNGGTWSNDSLVAALSDCGPLALVTSGTHVYLVYPAVPSNNPNIIFCDDFEYNNPGGRTRDTIDSGSPYSLDQPSLAVDGGGIDAHAAWKKGDTIWYAPRSNGTWPRLRVDQSALASKQPFVECYGDSVFVAWSDSMSGQVNFDVKRVRKALGDSAWRDWDNVSNSSGQASESPTLAWREFTTWSEGVTSAQPDIFYRRVGGQPTDLSNNSATWSYWTHSQMWYGSGFTALANAWTESPNANQPPFTVLTKYLSWVDPGSGDFGEYYGASAGGSEPSPYVKKRDGVLKLGDKAVDYAKDSLVYELPYLDPQYDYFIKVTSYREAGSDWAQVLSVDGEKLRDVQLTSGKVDTAWVKIPPKTYKQDRKVVFSFKKVKGDYVTSLGLMLYQRDPKRGNGGGQSGGVADMPVREVFAVYPNPSRGEAQVEYSLKIPGKVDLSVYDVTGRMVRKVVDGPQPAGVHKAVWDGRDALGRKVTNGVYFVRLSSPDKVKTVKSVVMR
jgi:hypothetical protein